MLPELKYLAMKTKHFSRGDTLGSRTGENEMNVQISGMFSQKGNTRLDRGFANLLGYTK